MFFLSKQVSVIIPTYNRKEYLLKTLYALAHNKYPMSKVEVIVADDGSSDGTAQELQKHHFPFTLKHVFQADKGYRVSKIRNEGVKVSSHDYIIFLDCDMVPGKNFIYDHIKVLQKNSRAVSLGHRKFVAFDTVTLDLLQNKINDLELLPNIPHRKTNSTEDWRLELYRSTNFLKNSSEPYWACSGGNMGIRKKFLIKVGLYDEDFVGWGREDNELGFRLFHEGAKFIPNLAAVAYHLDHEVDDNKVLKEVKKTTALFERKTRVYVPITTDNNKFFKNNITFLNEKNGVKYYVVNN
ncbi:glycosyltransferase [Candidatus Woesearchaeota archaeon]|nr:glycosyltransferase [Candidatus Woesearchaeota archaeon]